MIDTSRILIFTRPEDEQKHMQAVRKGLGSTGMELFLPGEDPLMSVAEIVPTCIVFGSSSQNHSPYRIVRSAMLLNKKVDFRYLESPPLLPHKSLQDLVQSIDYSGDISGISPPATDAQLLGELLTLAENETGVVPFVRKAMAKLGQHQTLLRFKEERHIRWTLLNDQEGTVFHADGQEDIPNLTYLSDQLANSILPENIQNILVRVPPLLPLVKAGRHLTWLLLPEPDQLLTSDILQALRVAVKSLLYRTEKQGRNIQNVDVLNKGMKEVPGVTLDRGAVIRSVDSHISATLGFTSGEMLGRRYFDFIPEDLRPDMIRAYLLRSSAKDTDGVMDIVLESAFGIRYTFEARFSPLDDESQLTFVELIDVTGFRTAAAEAQQRLYILERVIEVSSQPIFAAGLHDQIILCNNAAEKLTGWTHEELVHGKSTVRNLYPEGKAEEIMTELKRCDREESDSVLRNFETSLRTRDGRAVPVRITGCLLRDISGKVSGSIGIYENISEIRRMKAENVLLSKDALKQTRDQVVRGLAGATSHRLNQPLQAITTGLELLDRFIDNEETKQRVQHILKHTHELQALIQLLSTTKSYETESYGDHTEILSIKEEKNREP